MEQPPSKMPRLAAAHHVGASGAGTCFGTKNKEGSGSGAEEEASPMGLGLSLDLGGGGGGGYWSSKSSGFTFLQMQELEHQALIYTYIEAGLSVPHQLLLPIWKSVAGSLSGLHRQQSNNSHNHLLGSSPLYSEYYKSSMETEPRRCRRTDGKKWRCSRDVVPDHKYCDKHVHRGRPKKQLQPLPPKITTPTKITTATTASSARMPSFL